MWRAWRKRALTFAELGRWHKAASNFARVVGSRPIHAHLASYHALALLGAGDTEGYRRACAAMLQRFRHTKKPWPARWMLWACILAPEAVADLSPVVGLAEKSASKKLDGHPYVATLGAALYRSGRFAEARQRLREMTAAWEKSKKMPTTISPAYTWFFLAMVEHRLSHGDQARMWLARAVRRAEKELRAGIVWNRRLTLKLLRREAEALLGVTPTSAPAGRKEAAAASKPTP